MNSSHASYRRWGDLAADLRAAGLEADTEYPLAGRTTYGVGGSARCAVIVHDANEARSVATVMARHGAPDCLVVGKGSNLLVSDTGFDGVAVVMSAGTATDDVALEGELVVAGGATAMPVMARRSASLGRGGLEWAVGIPGTVGGAVRMNAGGHGADMNESVADVEVVSLRTGVSARVAPTDLGFHFRGSALAPHHLVVRVRFRSHAVDRDGADAAIDAIVGWRREHQPGGRNAGSVFVNPGDGAVAAGALIDACGMRGHRRGGAQVSEKHANFIVAREGTTAEDIVGLMIEVQDRVEEAHGVRLRSEVRLVGFPGEVLDRFADPRHVSVEHRERAQHLANLLAEGNGAS